MRWRGREGSSNVEDHRGSGGGRVSGRAKLGGGVSVVAVVVALLFGADPSTIMGLLGGAQSGGQSSSAGVAPPKDDAQSQFMSVVLKDTEITWSQLFKQMGRRYQEPKLVLFENSVPTACGFQKSAVGPFYCPGDQKAYIDLTFFKELHQRFGAPGDFAQAYVLAHEIGHHVQNLLGTSTKVHQARRAMSKVEGNKVAVKLELQADCYAGVWAHHANKERQLLEAGDVEEGLNAAAAIGDDTLQKRATGRVSPESWTHGSSKQRVKWFKRGMQTGRVEDCDTGL